jgi:hypothetical protein
MLTVVGLASEVVVTVITSKGQALANVKQGAISTMA